MYIVEPSALGSCINRHLSRQWLLGRGKSNEIENQLTLNRLNSYSSFWTKTDDHQRFRFKVLAYVGK